MIKSLFLCLILLQEPVIHVEPASGIYAQSAEVVEAGDKVLVLMDGAEKPTNGAKITITTEAPHQLVEMLSEASPVPLPLTKVDINSYFFGQEGDYYLRVVTYDPLIGFNSSVIPVKIGDPDPDDPDDPDDPVDPPDDVLQQFEALAFKTFGEVGDKATAKALAAAYNKSIEELDQKFKDTGSVTLMEAQMIVRANRREAMEKLPKLSSAWNAAWMIVDEFAISNDLVSKEYYFNCIRIMAKAYEKAAE